MVEIIPEIRKPSGLERFMEMMASGLRGGAEGGQHIADALRSRDERAQIGELIGRDVSKIRDPKKLQAILELELGTKAAKDKREQQVAALKGFLGGEAGKQFSDFEKQLITGEAMGLIPPGTGKVLADMRRQQESRNFMEQLFGDEESTPTVDQSTSSFTEDLEAISDPISQKGDVIPKSKLEKMPRSKLIKLVAMGGDIGEAAKSVLNELDKEREFEFKKGKEEKRTREALRAETLPIRKEYADKGRAAEQGIRNKEQLLRVIDTGNIDDPTFATFAQALPLRLGERLLSPETVTYRSGMVDEFRDLRTIFQGQTRIKEIDLLEDKIAGTYLTDSQKKAILKSRIDALQADVIKGQVAAELEEEGDFGGTLQFQKKVEERAKPLLDNLFNRILDQQKSIIQDAENRKKIPLNATDPESVEIMKQILQEAGGDKQKAKELAKKKGYSWAGMK